MAQKRFRAIARKRVKPATRWGVYVLMSVVLLAVLGAAGTAALLLAASPYSPTTAVVSTASQAANVAGASSSVRTLYVYGDGMRPLVEETDGVQTLNIYGPGGQIIAQVVRDGSGGQEVRYLLSDHLGSTRVALDADGNVVARFEYGPYGETTATGTAAAEVRYRYTGHPWDEAQGVYETPARGYDPALGRFLSVDPQRADASPYVYAGNNPVGYLDPTGGGPTPFIVKSGLKNTTTTGRATKTLAESLGAGPTQRIQDATSTFGEHGVELSYARDQPHLVLYGTKHPRVSKYNDKMYWLIGDEEPVKVPGDLKVGLNRLRSLEQDFARSIVLIDISSTGLKHVDISNALRKSDVQHGVVFGERVTNRTFRSANATQRTVNTVGMSAYGQEFELPEYRAYVEGVSEYLPRAHPSDSDTSFTLQSVPISHPQDGLSLESGSNAGTGSTSMTLPSGSEFPSVPPISLDAGVVTSTGSSLWIPQWGGPLED